MPISRNGFENDRHSIRVVIAESNEASRRLYDASLMHEGFDVVTVTNAVECLECMRDYPPDVLLLDLELPWGGGDGVLAVMAEEAELAHVPVLVHIGRQGPMAGETILPFRQSNLPQNPAASDVVCHHILSVINGQGICCREVSEKDSL